MKPIAIFLSAIFFIGCAHAQEKNDSWVFSRIIKSGSRGGTSKGVPVKIDSKTTQSWKALKEKGLSSFEKDRRAILALQGEFKAKFEFLETILLDTKLNLDVPYHSWGTEFVKLVEDKGDFISLQHILVMSFIDKETGETVGPYVVKHWRQDWTWEADEILNFQGDNHWKIENLEKDKSKGKWLWTVYQVDDTPRYSTLGKWNHLKSVSNFSTKFFTRPLPRREFSVRSDYKLLLGKDDIVLTKDSWYHEQKNFKHKEKLTDSENFEMSPLLSREIGHNAYLRLKNYNFKIGYEYWERTSPYWSDVRSVWNEIHKYNKDYKLHKKVDGKSLVMTHFKNAEDKKILAMNTTQRKAFIKKLLNKFMK